MNSRAKNEEKALQLNERKELMKYGYLPPQAQDLESAVIGALMLEAQALDKVLPILKADDFYVSAHERIYNAIVTMFVAGKSIDFMTVCNQLRQSGELEMVGGSYFVTSLTRDVISSAHIEDHARIVKQKSLLRKLIAICGTGVSNAYEDSQDVFDLITKVQLELSQIENEVKGQSVSMLKSVMTKTMGEMYEAGENESDMIGIATGFRDFDRITLGLTEPDLIVVAGGAGEGKSTFVLQMFKNMADSGIPVAFFSLEMNNRQLVWKMFSNVADLDIKTIRRGKLSQEKWQVINQQVERSQDVPLYLYDQGGLSIYELRSISRSLKAKYKIKAVGVDYLQLLTVEGATQKFGIREQEVNHISKQLKGMAKELQIPVIALSQLNRMEKGSKRLYNLGDLRDSGAIGQDADGVIFIWRPVYHGIYTFTLFNEEISFVDDDCVVLISKWRLGDTGYYRMKFKGASSRFEDYAPYADTEYKVLSEFDSAKVTRAISDSAPQIGLLSQGLTVVQPEDADDMPF